MSSLPPLVTVVVLTFNRCAEVLQTLAHLEQTAPDLPLVLVDNGSDDATVPEVLQNFPQVRIIQADKNLGAAGRNLGVRAVLTPYVAFSDDDTRWEFGAVQHAVSLLEQNPDIAVINARILVGRQGHLDPACRPMQDSPLGSLAQGRRLLGFMAGACVMRRSCFVAVGGYWPYFFIGGEEALMALEFADRGWEMVYASEVVTRHYPSAFRDQPGRQQLLLRNHVWTAWMRLPLTTAVRQSVHVLFMPGTISTKVCLLLDIARGLPRVLGRRRVVGRRVLQMLTILRNYAE